MPRCSSARRHPRSGRSSSSKEARAWAAGRVRLSLCRVHRGPQRPPGHSFDTGNITGTLTVEGEGTDRGKLRFLDPPDPAAHIEVRGKIGGRTIALELPDVT